MKLEQTEQDFELTGTPEESWDYFPVWDLTTRAKLLLQQIQEKIEECDRTSVDCDRAIEKLAAEAINTISHLLP